MRPLSDIYGKAEFQPGMDEEEGALLSTPANAPGFAAETSVPVIPELPTIGEKVDEVAIAGFSLFQKGLFLVVILGLVAMYMRMKKRAGGRYAAVPRSAV